MTHFTQLRAHLAAALDYLADLVRPSTQLRRDDLADIMEALGIRTDNLLDVVEGTELLFYRLDRDELRDLVRRHKICTKMDRAEYDTYYDPDHLRSLVVLWSGKVMEERRTIAEVLLGWEGMMSWRGLLAAGDSPDQLWSELTPTERVGLLLQGLEPSIRGWVEE